ncbi:MAG: hypothetical protein COT71_03520 [Candidatus Andersenbacteria bacterium CG10_big_fil_rev_8_21_14_0_10_54_11]|uniref:Uncharacterized protein n=1 Tax=Candidatus Andersenbacteria bacterium CG10_big_fil_rev_8_21_14_0_10_54_11 TaxID=1974485 RepID=A0A2M6WYP3_9BACT|nr:MAG: hypothetical protein COT71_03520 [Candidatus Andersenbacteria bacterium CG10_big_fil_rev_8_21_14_0_10_54_11]
MALLHDRLIQQMFALSLGRDFVVERSGSPTSWRYRVMKNGIAMTTWLTYEEMEDELHSALETCSMAFVDTLLS